MNYHVIIMILGLLLVQKTNAIIEPFSFDISYPESAFSKIERVCKELWNDLDVINANEQLRFEWIYNSDYLLNQFLLLHTNISKMLASPDESRIYLTEDIQYLTHIINIIEEKFITFKQSLTDVDDSIESIKDILFQSKIFLEQILRSNQEQILC